MEHDRRVACFFGTFDTELEKLARHIGGAQLATVATTRAALAELLRTLEPDTLRRLVVKLQTDIGRPRGRAFKCKVTRTEVENALRETAGNVREAATRLQVTSRTLYRRR
jgi:transcriptional regulator of acetoin/glycerol metabolism